MIRKLLAAAAGVLSLSLAGAASAATVVVPAEPDYVWEDGLSNPATSLGYHPNPHGVGYVVFTWDSGDLVDLWLTTVTEVTWGKVDLYHPDGTNFNESDYWDDCTFKSGCIKLIGERKAYAKITFPPEFDVPCVGPQNFTCFQRVNHSYSYSSFLIRGTPGDMIGGTMTLTDISPVPEPATWAMMIMGFGLAGVALRRRHATYC